MLEIQILNEESQLFKKDNYVINYTKMVIDYQWEVFRKSTNSHIFSLDFWMVIKGLGDLGTNFLESFPCSQKA